MARKAHEGASVQIVGIEAQAAQLLVAERNVTMDAARAPFSDQRVEVVLLNR